MPPEEAGKISLGLPDFIDESKLDCEYTSGEISKMFRVSGTLASTFIKKMASHGVPIPHKDVPHHNRHGSKKIYKLSNVLAAVINSGHELQPTEAKAQADEAKRLIYRHEQLLKEVEMLERNRRELLRDIDFLSGNLSDISPVLKATRFSLVPASELVKKSSSYNNICGIYFLIKNKQIVYIGQSRNIAVRVTGHKDKDFDSVSYVTCKKELLDITETLYILAYNPVLNGEIRTRGADGYRPCTPISLESITSMFSK